MTLLPTAKLVSVAASGAAVVALEQVASAGWRVVEQSPGGSATTLPFSGLWHPSSLAVDSAGDVYLVDAGNDRVLELVHGASSPVTLPFGSLLGPTAVALDQSGDVFVLAGDVASLDNELLELPARASAPVSLAMSSSSESTTLAVDPAGDVFVTSYVRSYPTPIDQVAELVAPSYSESVFPAELGQVTSLAATSSSVYLSCSGYFQGTNLLSCPDVMAFTPSTGAISPTSLGEEWDELSADPAGDVFSASGDGVLELAAGASTPSPVPLELGAAISPFGAALDSAGEVLVSDGVSEPAEVLGLGASGQSVLPFGGLDAPAVAADAAGDVLVADSANHRVLELQAGSSTPVTLTFGELLDPCGVAVDQAGDVFVADSGTGEVLELAAGSSSAVVLPVSGFYDCGIAADAQGDLFLADTTSGRVLELHAGASSPVTLSFSQLQYPAGVAVDQSGDVFVTDTGRDAVYELVASTGSQLTLPFSGLQLPVGIAVSPDGDVIVADRYAGVIELGAPASFEVSTTSLASGQVGVPYSATLSEAGGLVPLDWSVGSGSLPGGLSLDKASGVISGTPTKAASTALFFTATDAAKRTATSGQLSLVVEPAPSAIAMTTTALPGGAVASTYSTTLAEIGGVAPLSWSIASGSLPPGLELDPASGTIAGTPSADGTYQLSVQVQDATGAVATSAELTLVVEPDPPTLSSATAGPGDGEVSLAWSAPALGSTTGYALAYRAGPGQGSGTWTTLHEPASPLTATISGLADGTPYDFELSTLDGTLESAPSNVLSAAPIVVPAAGLELERIGGGDPAVDPGATVGYASVGQGIDSEDGDLSFSATDWSVATYGPPLAFTRTYDAYEARLEALGELPPGPLGNGWTDSFSTRILPALGTGATDLSGAVTLLEPSGGLESFTPPASSSSGQPKCPEGEGQAGGSGYCAPSQVLASLTKTSDGGFDLLVRGGSQLYYDKLGRLVSEVDSHHDTLTVSYDEPTSLTDSCPSTQTSFETVTSSSGRSLVVGWSESEDTGVITSLTDPLDLSVYSTEGVTWCYHYGPDDELQSVTDPSSKVTTLLKGVLTTADASPVTSYSYQDGSEPLLADDLVSVSSPNAQPGGPDAGESLSNSYSPSGRLTGQSDPMRRGSTLVDYSGLTSDNGSVKLTDPDGFSSTFTYNDGELSGEQLPDGSTRSYCYDEGSISGPAQSCEGPSSKAPNLDGVATLLVSSTIATAALTGAQRFTSATYDGQGDEISQTLASASNGAPDPSSEVTTRASYDTSGDLDLEVCSSSAMASTPCPATTLPPGYALLALGSAIPALVSSPATAPSAPPETAPPPDGDTYYLYDEHANLLATESGVYAELSGSAQVLTNLQVTYQLYDAVGGSNTLTLPLAGATGNPVTTTLTCSGSPPPATSLPCLTVTASGQAVASPLATSTGSADPAYVATRLAYDQRGDLTSSEVLSSYELSPAGAVQGGDVASETTFGYDDDGQQTSTTAPDGNAAGASPGVAQAYTTSTTYTPLGQPLTVTAGAGGKSVVVARSTTTSYDADGNVVATSRNASIELVASTSAHGAGRGLTLVLPPATKPGDELLLATTVTSTARAALCAHGAPGPAAPVPPAGFGLLACAESAGAAAPQRTDPGSASLLYAAVATKAAGALTLSYGATTLEETAALLVLAGVDGSAPLDRRASGSSLRPLRVTTSDPADQLVYLLGVADPPHRRPGAGGSSSSLANDAISEVRAGVAVVSLDTGAPFLAQLLAEGPGPAPAGAVPLVHFEVSGPPRAMRVAQLLVALAPSATNALVSTTTYNADDEPVLSTDPDGHATLSCFDADGNLVESLPPIGVASGLDGDACDPSVLYASSGGSYLFGGSEALPDELAADATRSAYDGLGEVLEQVTPGHELASAGPGAPGVVTTYTWSLDKLVSTDSPPTSAGGPDLLTSYTYNALGEQTSVTTTSKPATSGATAPYSSTTEACYDANGDEVATIAPDAVAAGEACSGSDLLAPDASACARGSYSSPASYATKDVYDSAGELVEQVGPTQAGASNGSYNRTLTCASYDDDGAVAAREVVFSWSPIDVSLYRYSYTPLGKVATSLDESVQQGGSSGPQGDYAYDANGELTSLSTPPGASVADRVSYHHDAFGELTYELDSASGTGAQYSYDSSGQQTSVSYLAARVGASGLASNTAAYGYDPAGNLQVVADLVGNASQIASNPDGLVSGVSLGGSGSALQTTYDDADLPATIALDRAARSNPALVLSYTSTPSGNVATETDSPAIPYSSLSYSYGASSGSGAATAGGTGNELTSVTATLPGGSSSILAYAYDQSGNRLSQPAGTGCYDPSSELTLITPGAVLPAPPPVPTSCASTATDSTVVYYDQAGERVAELAPSSGTPHLAAYDAAGDLTCYQSGGQYEGPLCAGGDATTSTSSTYGPQGLRSSATTSTVSASGKVSSSSARFAWDTSGATPQLLTNGTDAFVYDGGSAPFEQVDLATGAVSYLVADRLGSVRAVVGSSGHLLAATSYDPWGNATGQRGTSPFVSSLASYTPFGFAGAYEDPDGLSYLIQRFYDPTSGQFLTVDPSAAQGNARYAYAGDNPVNATDPSGASCLGPCESIAPVAQPGFSLLELNPAYLLVSSAVATYNAARSPTAGNSAVAGDVLGGIVGLAGTLGTAAALGEAAIGAARTVAATLAGSGAAVTGDVPVSAAAEGGAAATDATTQALQEHLVGALERFNVEGLTEGQQSALVDNPGLESAFRGQRIDTFFKQSLNNAIESGIDPRIANLYVTRSGEFGPDVFDLGSMTQWWDVTTPESWAQHVVDYTNPFGTGTPLFTP